MESAAIKAAKSYLSNTNNNINNGNPEGDFYNIPNTTNNINFNQSQIQSIVKKCLQTSWNSFEFSSDGNHLLLNSSSDFLLVLDGFRNDVEPLVITSRKNDAGVALGACFSANSKYVLTGNDDNDFLLLDRNSGELKRALTGHVAPLGCVCSNPKFDVFATGCVNSVLWIPKVQDDSSNNTSNNNSTVMA
jgi:WD40 repeat protein